MALCVGGPVAGKNMAIRPGQSYVAIAHLPALPLLRDVDDPEAPLELDITTIHYTVRTWPMKDSAGDVVEFQLLAPSDMSDADMLRALLVAYQSGAR